MEGHEDLQLLHKLEHVEQLQPPQQQRLDRDDVAEAVLEEGGKQKQQQ